MPASSHSRFSSVKRGLLLLVLLIPGAVAFLAWPPTPNFSSLAHAGDGYHVRILRDTYGVAHVYGHTDADAAYGLAYAHAEDDFLTIQQTLLAARGKLASVYGKDSAPTDYMVALLRIWDVVNARYDQDLEPASRAVIEAYAAGLNHYAYRHPASALPGLFPVAGKDVVAASVLKSPLFFDLDKSIAELFEATRQNEVSTPVANILGVDTRFGSNTLAVGPGRSADGSTYLAVNSHQPWSGPVAWYEIHVHSDEGWDMTGATFPATPAVIHGHNPDLGWAFTVNHADLTDIYLMTINPQDPNQYWYDGEWRDFEVRQAPITVKIFGRLAITVRQEALWSVYGPAVRRPHGVYSIRFAGFGRVDIDQQLYKMNKARNFAEWQDAMRSGGLPTFNVGYADREGNIYYLYNAMLPVRDPAYDWSKYLPGDTSRTLWTGYYPFDDLPQVLNPPSGFIQNANSTPYQTTTGPGNPDPAQFPAADGIETKMTNRALRLLEQLGGDDSITFDEFRQYKLDESYSARSDVAEFVRQISAANLRQDGDLKQAQSILRGWDLKMDAGSPAATIMTLTLYHLLNGDGKAPIKASALAGDHVPDEQVAQAFMDAVSMLRKDFGRVDVPWGEVMRLRRGPYDLPLSGGADTLRAIYGEIQPDGTFTANNGDGFIQLVRWDPQGQVQAVSIHQFGSATLDETSPHYADQSPLFAREEFKPAWFTEAEVRQHLEREYIP